MRMFIWCVLILMLGCDQDSPKDEYNDFRKRTAGARQDGCGPRPGARSPISQAFGQCVPF